MFMNQSINVQKQNLADIQSSWPHAWSITQLISHNPSVFCISLFVSCSIWGSLHVCIFNVIVLLLAISHIRASFSDPGENDHVISLCDYTNLHKRWKIVLDWKIILRQFPISNLSTFFFCPSWQENRTENWSKIEKILKFIPDVKILTNFSSDF